MRQHSVPSNGKPLSLQGSAGCLIMIRAARSISGVADEEIPVTRSVTRRGLALVPDVEPADGELVEEDQ